MDQSSPLGIAFSIVSQDDDEVFVHTKQSFPLMKAFQKYCTKKQLEYKTLVFLYDGNRITGRETPEMLHMKDGEQIEAFLHQNGGGVKGF